MIIDEAIRILKLSIRDSREHIRFCYDEKGITALEMAIKILKQESCDDVVSRQWLMHKATERFYTTNYFNHITKMIEEAPSVKPQTGYWIDREEYDADRWECSECGRTEQYKENYCPSCGARMESEQNG